MFSGTLDFACVHESTILVTSAMAAINDKDHINPYDSALF
jgi:hypothetical protein